MMRITNEEGAVWIRLNRPERANALSAELVDAMTAAMVQAIDARPRVLVLSGEGRAFCSGFDLSTLEEETDASLAYRLLRIERLLQMLHHAPCYTVALAHGTISGAGADLLAACSKRVVAPGSTLRFPGVRFGAVLGTRRLLKLVGPRACSIILEQETLAADEALKIGLASDIVETTGWPGLVTQLSYGFKRIPIDTFRRVLAIDRDNADGEKDMGVLAGSLLEPGLKERITSYWNSVRAARTAESGPVATRTSST